MRTLAATRLVLVLLTGCAVGPNYKQPPVTAPDEYREVQGPPAPAASLADQPWWEVFGDPVLQTADRRGPAATATTSRSPPRASRRPARAPGIARSEFFPSIDYGAEWSRGRNSHLRVSLQHRRPGTRTSVNVNFGWELDIWGRIRRLNESAKAQYLATEDARRGVLLSLVSDVARDVLHAARARRGARDHEEDRGSPSRKPTTSSSASSTRARPRPSRPRTPRRPSARSPSQIPELERRIEPTENQLNLLLGRNPGPDPPRRVDRRAAAAARGPGGPSVGAPPAPAGHPAGRAGAHRRQRPRRSRHRELLPDDQPDGILRRRRPRARQLLLSRGQDLVDRGRPRSARSSREAGSAASTTRPTPSGNRPRSRTSRPSRAPSPRRRPCSTRARRSSGPVARARRAPSTPTGKWSASRHVRYDSGLSNYFEVLYAMQLLFPGGDRRTPGRAWTS